MLALFRPTLYLLYLIFIVTAAILGLPSLSIHLLAIRILYPVLVAMLIEGWRHQDIAFPETSKERWITYLSGIPVHETHHALVNVHFRNRSVLVRKLTVLAWVKLVLVSALFGLSCHELWGCMHTDGAAFTALCSMMVTAFLAVFSYHSLGVLLAAHRNTWVVAEERIKNTLLYSAYLTNGEPESGYQPFLVGLFSNRAMH